MQLLDLNTGHLEGSSDIEQIGDVEISTDQSLADHVQSLASGATIAIRFLKFSDGRGFTQARRLRTEFEFDGALVAVGHIIPDQADYLRRCGFSHVLIRPETLSQWQFGLTAITTYLQHMTASPRTRDLPGLPSAATAD